MGYYLNPANDGFAKILKNKIYVDKSMLIAKLNEHIGTRSRFICISRPRRFGKSTAVKMLAAFYSRLSDSSTLFSNLKVASSKDYHKHLNCYNTIVLNISDEISYACWDVKQMLSNLNHLLIADLKREYPHLDAYATQRLDLIFDEIYRKTGIGFVFIIDEWDCILRERMDDKQGFEDYLAWLSSIFEDKPYVALAYMTGILPIKKNGRESALSMFREYSMIDPYIYASFIGFTEDEVKALCDKYKLEFSQIKRWYDGYFFESEPHIYNPYSVGNALEEHRFRCWWNQSGSLTSLRRYITMNFDGLKDSIIKLIAGDWVEVDVSGFQNDLYSLACKDDVLSLLIHLGYLAQKVSDATKDEDRVLVHIPNFEIWRVFVNALKNSGEYSNEYAEISARGAINRDLLFKAK